MTRRPLFATAALFAAILLAAEAAADPARDASCDPYWQTLDRATALRTGHDSDAAMKLATGILSKRPDDFRATYIVGLALIDKGQRDAGMKQLSHAADLLDRDAPCATANGWYSIYNTLGAEYYDQGNIGLAESNLNVAFTHFASFDKPTQQKLLSNLGLLYLRKGNLGKAQLYYQNASAIHAPGAAEKLHAVKGIASPAH